MSGDQILSVSEQKVLALLEQDARMPSLRIAKQLHLSAEGVNKIIERLVQRKIIAKFEAKTNYSRLGYTIYNVYCTLRNRDRTTIDSVYALYRKHRFIAWLRFTEGSVDMTLSFRVKDKDDIVQMHKILTQDLGSLIKERSIVLTLLAYEIGIGGKTFEVTNAASESCELSWQERQLLELLHRNARTPLVTLAGELGVSAPTVARMIKRLQEEQVIVGSKSVINPERLGQLHAALLLVIDPVAQGELARLREFARMSGSARYFMQVLGVYDIEITVVAPSINEFYSIVDEYRNNFSFIRSIDTIIYRGARPRHGD